MAAAYCVCAGKVFLFSIV